MAARRLATVARRMVVDTLVGLVEKCWTTMMWCWANSVASASMAWSKASIVSSPASRRAFQRRGGKGTAALAVGSRRGGPGAGGVRARREPQQDDQEEPGRPGAPGGV